MNRRMLRPLTLALLHFFLLAHLRLNADDSARLLRIDHYVPVKSIAPSMTGKLAQIYVREVVRAGIGLRGSVAPDRVILFVHGAGTPGEVAFDVRYQDYSWMAHLANAGFDVFAMDMTGYGRSTRPDPMNDPCNLTKEQQTQFLSAPCSPDKAQSVTTPESDWNDIGAVVDHLRKLRGVERVGLVGWSLGGPRAGGYAAQDPDKVSRLLLFSPAYRRSSSTPRQQPATRAAMNTQSRADFDANWDRQLGCPDQYDPLAREAVWSEMMAADPVGASWGSGVRRAPNVGFSGWDSSVVAKMQIPALFVAPVHDVQATPKTIVELMADYGAKDKILLDLACASHNALWERNHLLLFRASLEWFSKGSVNGSREGTVRMGY
ncbi:MAG TPA: alpha/beta hydrolase [Bryobacteraceae bacterium]|nr:alpha/beta hydrolase [Bryobacteraceae bacterium]